MSAPAAWAAGLPEIFTEITDERRQQNERWGEQTHPDVDRIVAGLGGSQATRYAAQFYGIPTADAAKAETDAAARAGECSWTHIAVEELTEAVEAAALGQEDHLRKELVQLSAVCAQWVQAIDRRRASSAATTRQRRRA